MEEVSEVPKKSAKLHNNLPLWGNEATMNLNPLILANIQSSSYFKVHLFKLKTYHEVVDEIYYQVKHMEPWERGSRKTSGQTGMCGGVRGVGAGGIVSTAFCLLYKLYTLRLTRKQVNGLLNHTDSPYIRALGFMYLRYTQPPGDLYDWYEDYLQDEEEIDVKAGGGQTITIGQMVYQFLTKLDWFSTLFPRIPVPIQKQIEKKLEQYCYEQGVQLSQLNSSARKGSVQPAEAGKGHYEDNYEPRHGGGDNSSSRTAARWEHDDRDAQRQRRRDDYDSYSDRERGRDYERERKSERSRERERGRRDYDEKRDYNERRDYERSVERRDYERPKERRDYEHTDDRRDGRERVREYDGGERHRDKHKKKKRKHHRSRSRSRSRDASKRERKREREGRSTSIEERRRR